MDLRNAPAPKPTLDVLLAGQPVGTWVVLDAKMSRVLSTGSTVADAIREAHIDSAGERPVMIQVPDPNAICFF